MTENTEERTLVNVNIREYTTNSEPQARAIIYGSEPFAHIEPEFDDEGTYVGVGVDLSLMNIEEAATLLEELAGALRRAVPECEPTDD